MGYKREPRGKAIRLTAKHKQARLEWARAYEHYTTEDWSRICFSDETWPPGPLYIGNGLPSIRPKIPRPRLPSANGLLAKLPQTDQPALMAEIDRLDGRPSQLRQLRNFLGDAILMPS